MSTPKPVRAELAQRLYVELVGRHSTVAEGEVRLAASAESLAALSLKLAETFVRSEEKATASRVPNSPFSLDASNIAEWSRDPVPKP
jgi:hypothetical protein